MGFFTHLPMACAKHPLIPQVLVIFLLADEGGHTAARLQSLTCKLPGLCSDLHRRSDTNSALICSYSANCPVATSQSKD